LVHSKKSDRIPDAEDLESRFRYYWSFGLNGSLKSKQQFNLLVVEKMDNNGLTVFETVNEIFTNNCDLPGISLWNLKNNLNEPLR